jgi:nicotinamidase-related amidase
MVRLLNADGSNAELGLRGKERHRQWVQEGTPGSQIWSGLFSQRHRGIVTDDVVLDNELLLTGRAQQLSAHEIVLYRPRWGAFYGSQLETHLRTDGVTTLVFASLRFQFGVLASIFEASDCNFSVVVAREATRDWAEHGPRFLDFAGIQTLAVQDIVEAVELGTPRATPKRAGARRTSAREGA